MPWRTRKSRTACARRSEALVGRRRAVRGGVADDDGVVAGVVLQRAGGRRGLGDAGAEVRRPTSKTSALSNWTLMPAVLPSWPGIGVTVALSRSLSSSTACWSIWRPMTAPGSSADSGPDDGPAGRAAGRAADDAADHQRRRRQRRIACATPGVVDPRLREAEDEQERERQSRVTRTEVGYGRRRKRGGVSPQLSSVKPRSLPGWSVPCPCTAKRPGEGRTDRSGRT